MDKLLQYFPDLSERQIEQFRQLGPLYREWNDKINVISRKDIDNLFEHHVLHSMAIAQVVSFKPKARVLDLGTGGGFPGIPLAILFPETSFTLVDGTRKKITVVQEVAEAVKLENVTARHIRVEELKGQFDFVVTRAVARLEKLVPWSFRLIKEKQQHALPNGLLALKGGNIKEEIQALGRGSYTEVFPLSEFFDLPYFEEKCIVYVQW
ncbi:16S rRNA (guanine(527)-N(7))-methyltransferase RsmG [Flavilitoribacter nigricans]|uniref:Ribosomal RNA small subunit methyltransferase G n=1 Tax=Flavilitoribacter nigricans (strain ATCC 23147 / DSM 23189 / NBRC 102662 / NCIMB 1420 / SS-2) TaxID=1122177 RepID=A0A2D0MYW5_FLAN2|nr:16S rRNA (guanine(527)-N(7))-methyltransferase RsmG [Flavilitoribacter nigricans]PHN01079.1 16S rRNA (guanine(527)-N(7))-methyltransferase RsmG [Flavilitoribacter nigricans DSM 23189 = NBRC 102662]